MLSVAILAGGLGTRMHPLTKKVPKAILTVAGRPFILHQLEYLRNQGIRNIVICVGHLGDMVKEVVGDGQKLGLNIEFSYDGPELLGTGGAIKRALPLLGDHFFVLYGDSYLPISFHAAEKAWRTSKKPALMTIIRNQNRWDSSNVDFKDGKLMEYNKKHTHSKMIHIDYGLSILSAKIFEEYADTMQLDLSDVFVDLSARSLLAGHEVTKRFYEIGSFSGLKDLEEYFLRSN